MKKNISLLIFITFCSVTVSAETWAQFIDRANRMTTNFDRGIARGHWSTWSNDKWGALMATTFWLEWAYEEIVMRAPISQAEREIYTRLWQRRITATNEMERLLRLVNHSRNDRLEINRRWEHWGRHLDSGGTIRMD